MHACMHAYTYVCMYVCRHVCIYKCMYVCTYVCVDVHVQNVYGFTCARNMQCISECKSVYRYMFELRNKTKAKKNDRAYVQRLYSYVGT